MPGKQRQRRPVRLRKGETITVHAGPHALITVERMPSGAVTVWNEETRRTLRQWTPKEAKLGW